MTRPKRASGSVSPVATRRPKRASRSQRAAEQSQQGLSIRGEQLFDNTNQVHIDVCPAGNSRRSLGPFRVGTPAGRLRRASADAQAIFQQRCCTYVVAGLGSRHARGHSSRRPRPRPSRTPASAGLESALSKFSRTYTRRGAATKLRAFQVRRARLGSGESPEAAPGCAPRLLSRVAAARAASIKPEPPRST